MGETPASGRGLLSDTGLKTKKPRSGNREVITIDDQGENVLALPEGQAGASGSTTPHKIEDSPEFALEAIPENGNDNSLGHHHKFPPSPPKSWTSPDGSKLFGMMAGLTSAGKRSFNALTGSLPSKPWWTDMLASPAKRKWHPTEDILGPQDGNDDDEGFQLPDALLNNGNRRSSTKPPATPRRTRRKDLPKARENDRNRPQIKNPSRRSKASLARAVEIAANLHESVTSKVEQEYYANSSIAAKKSKQNTVLKILKARKVDFPLTPEMLRLVAGSLKQAGYKSAYTYIIEAKMMHVEKGHPWTALLDMYGSGKEGHGAQKESPRGQGGNVVSRVSTGGTVLRGHEGSKCQTPVRFWSSLDASGNRTGRFQPQTWRSIMP